MKSLVSNDGSEQYGWKQIKFPGEGKTMLPPHRRILLDNDQPSYRELALYKVKGVNGRGKLIVDETTLGIGVGGKAKYYFRLPPAIDALLIVDPLHSEPVNKTLCQKLNFAWLPATGTGLHSSPTSIISG
jgi:hypothetical protein